jgi:hypothetical protein
MPILCPVFLKLWRTEQRIPLVGIDDPSIVNQPNMLKKLGLQLREATKDKWLGAMPACGNAWLKP